MNLTAAEVSEIMRLVEQAGYDELTLEIDGMKLSIRRGVATYNAGAIDPAAEQPSGQTTKPANVSAGSQPGSPHSADPDLQVVTAPMLGTFYRAPKPGAPPFVVVGARVEEDSVVGIIEVMKLMNTVRAGVSGTVAEILIADGVLAEYGQPLLRVRKAG